MGFSLKKTGRLCQLVNSYTNYGMSKAGNWFLAAEFACRYGKDGIISNAWNPGNLSSELTRDLRPAQRNMMSIVLYPPLYGAYTELYAGWSRDLTLENNGSFIYPWGRIGTATLRASLVAASRQVTEGGTGEAGLFWNWCERESRRFR